MRICIFGAFGRTGIEVVAYAKKQGFDVVGFSNNEVDVTNYTDVYGAIKGSDAVISVIGHIKGSDALVQTKGMIHIIKAMDDLGIKRLLSLTGTGARIENDTPSLSDIFLNFFVRLIDPKRITDGTKHIEVLKNSSLDWTVVRVLKLTNSTKEIKSYRLTEGGPVEFQTSRKKVAKILIDLINDKKYIKRAPVVSG